MANRVQAIRDRTSPKQWNYVDTKDNPADDAKRPGSSTTDQKQQMVEWAKLLVEKIHRQTRRGPAGFSRRP